MQAFWVVGYVFACYCSYNFEATAEKTELVILCVNVSTRGQTNLSSNCEEHCHFNKSQLSLSYRNLSFYSCFTVEDANRICEGLKTCNTSQVFNWSCYEQNITRGYSSQYNTNKRPPLNMPCIRRNNTCKVLNKSKKCLLIHHEVTTTAPSTTKALTSITSTRAPSTTRVTTATKATTTSPTEKRKVTNTSVTTVIPWYKSTSRIEKNDMGNIVYLISGWVFGGLACSSFLVLLLIFIRKKRKARKEEYQLSEMNRTINTQDDECRYQCIDQQRRTSGQYQELVFNTEVGQNPYAVIPHKSTVLSQQPVITGNATTGVLFATHEKNERDYQIFNNIAPMGRTQDAYDDVQRQSIVTAVAPYMVSKHEKEHYSASGHQRVRNEASEHQRASRAVTALQKSSQHQANGNIRNRLELLLKQQKPN